MKRIFIFPPLLVFLFFGCSKINEPVASKEGKIIVLMYHRIVTGDATYLYERSTTDLETDLIYLKRNNVKTISFSDLEKCINSGKMPEGNSAIITFDDGDYSWYSLARPLLLKYNMKATFFLWTQMVDQDTFISWDEVESMAYYTIANGDRPFTFGSHTCSHQYLLERKADYSTDSEYNVYLNYEFGESKRLIDEHVPDMTFVVSLPYGDGVNDPEIMDAAQRNGYKFMRTSIWDVISNTSVNPFSIPSLPILNETSDELIGEYLGI